MSGKWPKYPYAHYSVDYKVHSCLIIIIQCCFCCSCFSCTLVIQVCLTLYITVFFFHISIWEIFAFYNSKHSLCVDVLLVMQSIVCKFNVIISSFTFQYWNTYNRLQNQLDWTEIKWSKYWRSILTKVESICYSERDRRYCQLSNLCIVFDTRSASPKMYLHIEMYFHAILGTPIVIERKCMSIWTT